MPDDNEAPANDQRPEFESVVDESSGSPVAEPTLIPEPAEPKQADQLPKEPTAEHSAPEAHVEKSSRWRRLRHWYGSHKKWSIPLTVLVMLLVIALIPWTRYPVAGLVLKKDFTVQVLDSETNSPVSGASVSVGSVNASTGGDGKATLSGLKVGHHSVTINKKYYQDKQASVLVPVLSQKSTPSISFEATGRQVKILVTNLISHKALGGVDIKVADIEAKTDQDGNAAIVLPVGITTQKATLSLNGYNQANVTVKVSDKDIAQNDLTLTPVGKIYFLSKRTGKINVMKGDLDGSHQKVVLSGTGNEDEHDTVLLASRDWKYLALKASRDKDKPKLYLIETATDKLSTIDEGDATFNPVGWNNEYFVYTIDRNNVQIWKPNREALKSFNANTKQIAILNQTGAAGSANDYTNESLGDVYIFNDNVIFSKSWEGNYGNLNLLNGKYAGIYSIGVNGNGYQVLKTFKYTNQDTYFGFSSFLYQPGNIYYSVYSGITTTYFKFVNAKVVQDKNIADSFKKYYNGDYPTYLISPSGKETFWSESRDGKSTLFIGDSDAQGGKQIAAISDDYKTYGWFTDNYLLVSKKSSELFIMPRAGVKDESQLVKISDYHKPDQSFYGYGGGYGGI